MELTASELALVYNALNAYAPHVPMGDLREFVEAQYKVGTMLRDTQTAEDGATVQARTDHQLIKEASNRVKVFVDNWPPGRSTRGGLDRDLIHGVVKEGTDESVDLLASDLRTLLEAVRRSLPGTF